MGQLIKFILVSLRASAIHLDILHLLVTNDVFLPSRANGTVPVLVSLVSFIMSTYWVFR